MFFLFALITLCKNGHKQFTFFNSKFSKEEVRIVYASINHIEALRHWNRSFKAILNDEQKTNYTHTPNPPPPKKNIHVYKKHKTKLIFKNENKPRTNGKISKLNKSNNLLLFY